MRPNRDPSLHVVVMTLYLFALVSDLVVELINFHITLTPELAILDIDLDNSPLYLKTLIHIILFAACTSITSHWKMPNTPSFIELTRRINLYCHNELTLTPFNPHPSKRIDSLSYWIFSKYYS